MTETFEKKKVELFLASLVYTRTQWNQICRFQDIRSVIKKSEGRILWNILYSVIESWSCSFIRNYHAPILPVFSDEITSINRPEKIKSNRASS